MATKTEVRPLHTIASEIIKDWGSKINFAAKPYLIAMLKLNKITDTYIVEDAKTIVIYFLNNAGTWRGDKAREIKKELKKMAGI